MTEIVKPSRRMKLVMINLAANFAALALLLAPIIVLDWTRFSTAMGQAHAPRLDILLGAPPLVLAHLGAVGGALWLGPFLLFGRKGARLHRALGWAWVALTATGAITSVFLRGIPGGFSGFHVITAITLLLLPLAILAARTHRVRWHAGLMIYLAVNVILAAGLIALYPGFSARVLVQAVFH